MLAVVGFVTEEYFHLPGAAYTNYNPLGAIAQVGTSVNGQVSPSRDLSPLTLCVCVLLAHAEERRRMPAPRV